MNRNGIVLLILAAVSYLFLLAPMSIVFVLAFSADTFMIFPPSGFSLRWFNALLENRTLMDALGLSLQIAPIVVSLSLLVGVPAALALAKGNFPGRASLQVFFLAPILLPALILGLALLNAMTMLRATGTLHGLVAGHLIVTVPFVIRLMTTAFTNLPQDLESAAATLGAQPHRVVFRVTLPLVAPALIASAALSFLLSFDETVISLFISGPRATTLPVAMMQYVQVRTDPLIAALSIFLILGTLIFVLIIDRLVGLGRAIGSGK